MCVAWSEENEKRHKDNSHFSLKGPSSYPVQSVWLLPNTLADSFAYGRSNESRGLYKECNAPQLLPRMTNFPATLTCFLTDPTDLDLVSRALPTQGFTVLSAKLGYKAKNPVNPTSLTAEQLEEVDAFLNGIDGNDDVQNVYVALAA